jgi:hypothetical protein
VKRTHPDSAACTTGDAIVCVEQVNYADPDLHALVHNMSDYNLGYCHVAFLLRDRDEAIMLAPLGYTPVEVGPKDQAWVGAQVGKGWPEPIREVQLYCSSAQGTIDQRLKLAWPVFDNMLAGWQYKKQQGY